MGRASHCGLAALGVDPVYSMAAVGVMFNLLSCNRLDQPTPSQHYSFVLASAHVGSWVVFICLMTVCSSCVARPQSALRPPQGGPSQALTMQRTLLAQEPTRRVIQCTSHAFACYAAKLAAAQLFRVGEALCTGTACSCTVIA